jgi:cysteine-rich repeat protein
MRTLVLSLCLAATACGTDPGVATDEPAGTGVGPTSETGETGEPATTSAPATASDPPGGSTSQPPEGCGDGVTESPEECDFGDLNADDGPCTLSCTFARCGDGLVYAGVEVCDDGNLIESDDCPNDCVPGGCGNGVVESGEACDDGNDSQEDACLGTCEEARCGDGFVHAGVEECDDGDDDDNDQCTTTCVAPTCSDGVANGYEPDVDCGGPYCGKCSLGEGCFNNGDCDQAVCKQQECVPPMPLMPPDCAPAQVSAGQAWQAVAGACNCHGKGVGTALIFKDGPSFRDSMVGVPSTMATIDIVTAGDVDRSYLLFKLLNQQTNVVGGGGNPMPIGKVLTEGQLCTVIEWVRSGAN